MGAFQKITESDIRSAVAKLDFRLKSMTRDQFADRLVGLMNGDLMPKDVQGIDDETMERIYALAYASFHAGRSDDARTLFQFLCMNDYLSHKYWLGLGACDFADRDYERAAKAYGMAGLTGPGDPRPRLRLADCWMAMGRLPAAVEALELAIEICGSRAEHAERRVRAERLIHLMEKRAAEAAEA